LAWQQLSPPFATHPPVADDGEADRVPLLENIGLVTGRTKYHAVNAAPREVQRA